MQRASYPVMTNAERQAAFRRRHPDYYRNYRRRMKATVAALLAEKAAAQQLALARANQPAIPLARPAPPVRLCLPAPSEEPMFILPAQHPERELVLAASTEPEEPKRLAA